MTTFLGILFFSAIETVAVIVWAALAFHDAVFSSNGVIAAIVLFLFYVVEHLVAFNVGKGRPFFSFPPKQ